MRECGACTACCVVTFVPELGKREGMACNYCNSGCSIYSNRPNSCRGYECEWLKGVLPEPLRPDICGVVLERHPKMIAALLLPWQKLDSVGRSVLEVLDTYVCNGLPVIATGQFARLPKGMTPEEAKRVLIETVHEVRP